MRDVITSPWMVWTAAVGMWAGAAAAYLAGNALLRLFAAREPKLWQQARMPTRFFGGTFFSREQRGETAVQWLTKTPVWVAQYPDARGLLSLVRVGTAVMAIGLITIMVVVLWA